MSDCHPIPGSTVLVTGGAGLIGSHIVDRLIAAGAAKVRVLDNFVRGCPDNLMAAVARGNVVVIQDDVREPAAVARATDGCDYVFHQAAIRITRCAEAPQECVDVLVNGTLNVFQAAADAGVKKVVYASSASVYGAAERFPTDERHHPYNNRTLYGWAKLMDEGIAHAFHDANGLASVGLRYFNVYGPRMDVTGAYTEVLIRWLDCIARGEPPSIFGGSDISMDFVYVEDVARANLLALQSDRADDVYNVGSGRETTLLQLWEALRRATGAYHLQPVLGAARKVNGVPRRLAAVGRAAREIGFEAAMPLDQGLARLVNWCEAARTVAPSRGVVQ